MLRLSNIFKICFTNWQSFLNNSHHCNRKKLRGNSKRIKCYYSEHKICLDRIIVDSFPLVLLPQIISIIPQKSIFPSQQSAETPHSPKYIYFKKELRVWLVYYKSPQQNASKKFLKTLDRVLLSSLIFTKLLIF